jgi:polyhydroxyalkanoate synthesis regulator phasin
MSKLDILKSRVNEAEDFARKIWLAGLGAYGKSIDEAQGRYEKLSSETTKVFDELVVKGEKIESETKEKIIDKTNIEERVADVRKKLGLDKGSSDARIDELSDKIDALTDVVNKLVASK